MSDPRSRTARPGREVIGKLVAAPETRNRPSTATYVVKQTGHRVFRTANEAYARYMTAASARVEPANRYPGALSRAGVGPTRPASETSVANANQIRSEERRVGKEG